MFVFAMGIYFFVKALPRFSGSSKKISKRVLSFFIRKTFFMRRFEKGGKARAESSRRSRTSLQASEQASFDGSRLSGDKCDDDEPEPGAKTNEGLGLGSRAHRVSLNFLRLCLMSLRRFLSCTLSRFDRSMARKSKLGKIWSFLLL